MDLNIKPLRCFVAIAAAGSFTAAAQKMHLTQPSVSAQIRALEAAIGFSLFERTTRRVELTANGAALLPLALQMVETNDRLIQAIKSLARTNQHLLAVGASFYTNDISARTEPIDAYCKRYPQVKVNVDGRPQTDLMDALRGGKLDLCFLLAIPVSRAEYDRLVSKNLPRETVYPDDLPAIVMAQERVQLQVPRSSPLAGYTEIPLAALTGQRVVGIADVYGAPLQQPVNHLLTEAGAALVEAPETSGVGIERYGRQMGIAAVSIGWLHETAELARDTVRLPLQDLTTCIDLVLVRQPGAMSEPARQFWSLVEAAVSRD